jgi:hypothetical protein
MRTPPTSARAIVASQASLALLALLAALTVGDVALAKKIGIATPTGRSIYGTEERFGDVTSQSTRSFVAEVAMGAGPGGNLALLLGWLNVPFQRFDIYAGIGFEANPATLYTLGGRYVFSFDGFHPYLSAGYLYKDSYEMGITSNNVFAELGYRWSVHQTYRVAVGVGIRRQLNVAYGDDSILNSPSIDPVFRAEQLATVDPWLPTFVLRLSRAF